MDDQNNGMTNQDVVQNEVSSTENVTIPSQDTAQNINAEKKNVSFGKCFLISLAIAFAINLAPTILIIMLGWLGVDISTFKPIISVVNIVRFVLPIFIILFLPIILYGTKNINKNNDSK